MGNEQSNKKGKKILEDKKKQMENLTNKKEKLDKMHKTVYEDINSVNNFNQINYQHPSNPNFNPLYHHPNTQISNNIDHNNIYRNKSVMIDHKHNIDDDIFNDKKFNNRNLSANKIPFYEENQNNNYNKNDIKNNITNEQDLNSIQFPRRANTNIPIIQSKSERDNIDTKLNFPIRSETKVPLVESNNEKLAKDIDIMEKLVEKYKIIYLDSYYFKRDKNYHEALERNLTGQEYVNKLLNILLQKKEKEFDKYINIVKNLENQFITLMQEIEQELKDKGKNHEEIIKNIKLSKNYTNISNNNDYSRNNPNINKNNSFSQQNNQNQQPFTHKSNIPNEILERIKSEILNKDPKVKFDEVVGLDKVKQALKEIIIIPSLRPDLFTGLRTPAKGLLLFGPPGTGKTLIAKAVATECKSTFFNISASSLTSKYVGESEKLVKALFEVAHYPENQPAIIFIDEIESILSKRSESENEATKRLKTEFLIQFDGVGTNSNDRVLVIGATNRPQDLDPAVLRRLPKKIFVGPMDFNGRAHFIFEILQNTKTENNLGKEEFKKIASLTENYSNSDLKELCRQACIEPIRELKETQLQTIDKLRPICLKDFLKAINVVRGTLTNQMLDEYSQWNSDNGALN